MFEDNIDVKIGRVLFEKQTGKELYDAAIGLKELFDQREKKDAVAGTMAIEIAIASYFEGCSAGAALASSCMLDGTGYQGLSNIRVPFEVYLEAGMEANYECAYFLGFEFDHGYPPYIPQNPVIAAHFLNWLRIQGVLEHNWKWGIGIMMVGV